MNENIEKTYKEAVSLLLKLGTPHGFTASNERVFNYYRVWSRDGIVIGLASLISKNEKLIKLFRQTLITLKKHQDETGRIPSNVALGADSSKNKKRSVSYGSSVGRVDATIWYIIGVCVFARTQKDKSFFKEFLPSLKEAIFYLECLELNGKGLIYIPQGGDWADEYINHGYVLFDQVLYMLALKEYADVSKDPKTKKKYQNLKNIILVNYFPEKKNLKNKFVYHDILFKNALKEYKGPFPIAYFSGHSVRYHIDNFANALLLLSGILTPIKENTLKLAVLKKCSCDLFPIIPAFYPVINPGDINWDKLRYNHLFGFRNKPHEYHNGGLWPLIHGFYIASYKRKGMPYLNRFADALAKDNFLFPEFFHGEKFNALGTRRLGFSAASFIISYEAIKNGKKIFV